MFVRLRITEKDKIFWVLPRIEDRKVAVTEEEGQEQADPLSGVMRRYETLVRPSLYSPNENTCRNDQHHLLH